MELHSQDAPLSDNPLDLVEELISANDWLHDRSSESELLAQAGGKWGDYNLCVVWQPELGAMYLSCHIESKLPPARRAAICELLALVNEKLWLGHFDLCSENGLVMFRHTIPLRGTRGASVEQIEDLIDTALGECERLYPALQMVAWGGQPVGEALAAALMETVGEA
jgi:hypothetical protein